MILKYICLNETEKNIRQFFFTRDKTFLLVIICIYNLYSSDDNP